MSPVGQGRALPRTSLRVCSGILAAALAVLAATRAFPSYTEVKPVLEVQRDRLPAALQNANEARWLAWSRQHDKAIRARLDQGDLDSMVNLLLYGTSFTRQPRVRMEGITEASKSGVLRARVDDLVAGLRSPGDNQRLAFLRELVRAKGLDPEASGFSQQAGMFLYKNLLRVIEERRTLAERAAADRSRAQPADPASLLDRSSLFADRGVSLDTGLFPNFAIEQTLRDLKKRGVLRDGQVSRVAVIGPGLDFVDKNEESAYDYYPQQTLQPFALYDSLLRLRLARSNALSLTIFDISSRVREHIRRAREQAARNIGYTIQLPRDQNRPWPPDLVAYWRAVGDQVGTAVAPIVPPEIFPGLETRAVKVRPEVVLACEALDLDIVLERLHLRADARFDLIVGTNIFVYYDPFEESLALENAGAMLNSGGLLLTNDRLPAGPASSIGLAGVTIVSYDTAGMRGREAVGWYRKQ